MALEHPIDTDDGAVPRAIRRFIRNRVMELTGLILFAAILGLGAALATWSPADPSFDRAIDGDPRNLLGWPGAMVSDLLIKFLGLAVIPFVTIPLAWAAGFLSHRGFAQPFGRGAAWLVCSVATAAFLAMLPAPRQFALEAGLGGQLGAMIEWSMLSLLGYALKGLFAAIVSVALFGCIAVSSAARALGLRPESATVARATEMLKAVLGRSWFLLMFAVETVRQWLARRREAKVAEVPRAARRAKLPMAPRVEPKLGKGGANNPPWLRLPANDADEDVIDVDEEEETEEGAEEEEEAEEGGEEEGEEEEGRAAPAIG
ncbi:MAG: DNA translocase FtsK 4TM domain-containing protein, partial [Parvibaculaceae bacterium]